MPLIVIPSVFETMLETARAAAPLEACGLLAGTGERVTRCYVLTNADAAAEHYRMLPEEQFAALKDMRQHGLKMLAIWHSHPATPARMSAEDLRLAYTPDVGYVILSLADARAPVLRAFQVSEGIAQDLPLRIEAPAEISPLNT